MLALWEGAYSLVKVAWAWGEEVTPEKPNTIELISIGMVKERGEDWYAKSYEFDCENANDWVKNNLRNVAKECPLWIAPIYAGIISRIPSPYLKKRKPKAMFNCLRFLVFGMNG